MRKFFKSRPEIKTIENADDDIAQDFVDTLRNDAVEISKLYKNVRE